MPSPLPGMDPFIEYSKWRDFHTRLITVIAEQLTPSLVPDYATGVEERVVLEAGPDRSQDRAADVAVFDGPDRRPEADPEAGALAVLDRPRRVVLDDEAREHYVEVFSPENGRVVTVIEVLSPTNKRPSGADRLSYVRERRELLSGPASLVEIDLLRGGRGFPVGASRPPAFTTFVSSPWGRPEADLYGTNLFERLLRVAVPLDEGVDPAPLDVQAAVDAVYDRAGYAYTLKYEEAGYGRRLDPPLPDEAVKWVEDRLAAGKPTA